MLSRALFSTEPVIVGPEAAPHSGELSHLRREASGSVSASVSSTPCSSHRCWAPARPSHEIS
jgi:hypothetical protein